MPALLFSLNLKLAPKSNMTTSTLRRAASAAVADQLSGALAADSAVEVILVEYSWPTPLPSRLLLAATDTEAASSNGAEAATIGVLVSQVGSAGRTAAYASLKRWGAARAMQARMNQALQGSPIVGVSTGALLRSSLLAVPAVAAELRSDVSWQDAVAHAADTQGVQEPEHVVTLEQVGGSTEVASAERSGLALVLSDDETALFSQQQQIVLGVVLASCVLGAWLLYRCCRLPRKAKPQTPGAPSKVPSGLMTAQRRLPGQSIGESVQSMTWKPPESPPEAWEAAGSDAPSRNSWLQAPGRNLMAMQPSILTRLPTAVNEGVAISPMGSAEARSTRSGHGAPAGQADEESGCVLPLPILVPSPVPTR